MLTIGPGDAVLTAADMRWAEAHAIATGMRAAGIAVAAAAVGMPTSQPAAAL